MVKNHAEVAPPIEEWKRIKALGWGVSSLLVIAGVSAASIASIAWDWFAAVVMAQDRIKRARHSIH